MDFCTDSDDPHDPVAAVHRCIHSAATLLEPDIRAAGLPVRFATTKLVEDDEQIKKKSPFLRKSTMPSTTLFP